MTTPLKKSRVILMAEDDEDHYLLTKEAFAQCSLSHDFRHVEDGEKLMAYLLRQGVYQNPKDSPRPSLILLDLNMPLKNGYEALKEIKAHPELRRIPVVVLTVSRSQEDVIRCYEEGANSFLSKPLGFQQLVDMARTLKQYWFDTAELPNGQML